MMRLAMVLASASTIGLLTAASAGEIVPAAKPVPVEARRMPLVGTIDERFQSFQIGFSHLTGGETWKSYDAMPKGQQPTSLAAVREARTATDLANPRLRTLTGALAPFYLRYSGTTANSVYFHDSDSPPPANPPEGYTVVLTRQRWKGALDFAKAVDAKVVTSFANSDGVRDAAHTWTPRMAASWMAYTHSIGGEIYAAELFNEPNAPEPPRILKGISAPDFARDFSKFQAHMARAAPSVKLAGPGNATLGVAGVDSLMGTTAAQYAAASPTPKFDIVSYHFYPALAQRCAPANSPQGISADRALTEEFLSRPDRQFQNMKTLRDRYAPHAPIWLTETGGAACGGLVWQPTFLDVFRYVDTHARLARQGLDAMFTHALLSGSNGLIDEKTLEPNASYWAAVLWRRLMGTQVLDAGTALPRLHLYAHCLRGKPGGVAVIAINLSSARAALRADGPADVYALTAPELESRQVLLNGRPLAIGPNDRLPAFAAARFSAGQIGLAPHSVNFVALPRAGNPVCTG